MCMCMSAYMQTCICVCIRRCKYALIHISKYAQVYISIAQALRAICRSMEFATATHWQLLPELARLAVDWQLQRQSARR